jgi:hypothetical protein
MAGQLTQVGDQFLANKLSGQAKPFVGASAPGSWIPGQEWINTSAGNAIYVYDPFTSTWVAGPYDLYLALLILDPTINGPGGGAVQTIQQCAALEDTTTGYLRQPFPMSTGTAAVPSVISNLNTTTFGPYTANQATQVSWAALMAIPRVDDSGNTPIASTVFNGLLMYTWTVPVPQQVLATQSIQIAPGQFQIGLT